MNKKTKIVIPLAILAIAVAIVAYLKFPVSTTPTNTAKQQDSLPKAAAKKVSEAASGSAAVDSAVDAVLQGYEQDQAVAQQEDVDASYVEGKSTTINALSEAYHENDF